jgi:AraC-like DNA-binding protein
MTAADRDVPGPGPFWSESRMTSGRGDVGTGLFQRVHFVDVFDAPLGRAVVRTLRLPTGPAPVSEVVSTGHEVALEEERTATLLLPLSGRIFCALNARDLEARPGQAMLLPRGRRRTVTLRDGKPMFRALVLRLAALDADARIVNGAVLEAGRFPDLAAASAVLTGLLPGSAAAAELAAAQVRAAETLIEGLFADLPAAPPERMRSAAADRALRRAEDLLQARADEDVAIREIAAAAGLSMRQMQHLFAQAHGLSPHGWLTRLRLERARLRLKGGRPAPSVTDVALSAGFGHLGRFPSVYRARFGTLPSQDRAALR